jgi:hypothetical protein
MTGQGASSRLTNKGAEPHHVPHGYVHPKERHHWYWYGGFAVAALAVGLMSWVYWQYDHGAGPLCESRNGDAVTSPGGGHELQIVRVSCPAVDARQLVFLRNTDGGFGSERMIGSFDAEATLRLRWLSDEEAFIRRRGGQMWAFQPSWNGVHVTYRVIDG